MRPYFFNGELVDPGVDVVSFYADQFPEGEVGRSAAERYEIPLFDSIDEALCVGGKELAVDAVLAIGEHGEYPTNQRHQKQYPRKEFFDQALAVMRRSGRYVPYFNDKHLSWRFDWAREMYDAAREHGFPLFGGSSVPYAQRRPDFELPPNAVIEEAVSIHGGELESYDIHGIEVLQAIVEKRRGGETGVASVQYLSGEALRETEKQGLWSRQLAEDALQAEFGPQRPTLEEIAGDGLYGHRFTYRDGMRGLVLRVGSNSKRWLFGCRLKGETDSRAFAHYVGPWGNRCLFKGLAHAIQTEFRTGKEPIPAERCLLTTGMVDFAMRSWEQQGKAIETPELHIPYQPIDETALRETGRTWEIIRPGDAEPHGFEPGDARWLQLDEAAMVSGTVSVAGEPLAAGRLGFWSDEHGSWGCDVKDGRYSMARVPAGEYRVKVFAEKYSSRPASRSSSIPTVVHGTSASRFDFDLP